MTHLIGKNLLIILIWHVLPTGEFTQPGKSLIYEEMSHLPLVAPTAVREKKPWRHLPVHATLSLTWKSPGKARTMDGFTLRSSPGKCLRRRESNFEFPAWR